MVAPRKHEPIAYAVKDAAAAVGVSPSMIYKQIDAGEIVGVKWVKGKQVIPAAELMAWFDALPESKPEPQKRATP